MKLIEGMKNLKVLEKRMETNVERIQQYAAIVSTEKPVFANEIEQRAQVASLITANEDLVKEYMDVKKRVDLTNLNTVVTIGKESFTISDLLVLRRGLGRKAMRTYSALNDTQAESRMRSINKVSGDKTPQIERMYDEKDKYAGQKKWQDLLDEIETRLEVINATTDLQEL